MELILSLLRVDSVAHAVIILSLVSACGLALGSVRVFKVNLGLAGVLFSGLLFGYLHLTVNDQVLEFTRDLGLILFVYAIGLQVGPGFLSSMRRQGFSLNMLAVLIVLSGVAITGLVAYFGRIPPLLAVGLYSGAVTNSPSLGAVQQVLKDIPGLTEDAVRQPALGLALAYPFGIVGTILAMVLARVMFRINVKQEFEALEKEKAAEAAPVMTLNVEVKNPNLAGRQLEEIPGWGDSGVVVSRLWDGRALHVATPQSRLSLGNVLLAVGSKERLNEFQMIVGTASELDLRTLPSAITSEQLVVTNKGSVGKTLLELDFLNLYGVALTRVLRGSIELTATPSLRLQFGDTVVLVGEEAAIRQAGHLLGNAPHHLNLPQLLPMFIGMGLGVLVGSIPFHIPGLPAPVRLGLAGGPLIVAMILARVGRIGPAVWYLPLGANFLLRDLGLVFFLAGVGLRAGEPFFDALAHPTGWYWMACASLITVVPLMIAVCVARWKYKVNYLSLCGFLAGSMNSPTLAFANALAPSEAPSIAFATVYPLVMLLRILTAQVLVLFFLR